MEISKEFYGKDPDGNHVDLFTLRNDTGMVIKITNYGGIITNIFHANKKGKVDDIVLGFDNLDGYLGEHPYFGAIIGRVANRISQAKFTLNSTEYKLVANLDPHHIHGGTKAFDKVIWKAEEFTKKDSVELRLKYFSKDMEEGYPGNLDLTVSYILNNNNELIINYFAESDKDTILNLTNHTYFNLNGVKSNIKNHLLKLDCNKYTVSNPDTTPTGEIRLVENTPYNFKELKPIGRDWEELENGYDHNFVVQENNNELVWFGYVEDPETGRSMEIATTEPGVQLYTSNFLKNLPGKSGKIYNEQDAFCLETQHFPDSMNHDNFPEIILRKGETYKQTTIYKFNS